MIEVLTAATIMASVLAIGVPQLTKLRGPYALAGAVRQVQADIQVARQKAIARNARYRITYGSTSYRLQREASANTFVDDGAPQKLPAGVTIGSVSSTPVFDTRGMLTTNVTVPVTAGGTGTRTVTVNVLGRTTIN